MSETSGPQTGNKPGQHMLGSVGPTLDGMKTRIADPDPDGNGEIVMFGRNIMMGYLFNEEKTKEAIDEDGWLHSGDIGRELTNGYIKITGRYVGTLDFMWGNIRCMSGEIFGTFVATQT